MQTLLTIGERTISTALRGRNTGAAKRVLSDLMQSDLVVPLLVATSSAQRSAHVQEGLLRLQLQKLRYQLAVHEQDGGGDDVGMRATVGSPKALDELLPDSLLDDDPVGSSKMGAQTTKPLAVTSTGLQPVALSTAAAQLWQSLALCMQPSAPLLRAQRGSGGAALAAGVQQLAAWSLRAGDGAAPPWLPGLHSTLQAPQLQAQLDAQLPRRNTAEPGGAAAAADWGALLAQEAPQSAPVLTALAAAAVSTGPSLRRAWLSFGDCLYTRVRRARHARRSVDNAFTSDAGAANAKTTRSSKAPLTASDEACYRHVVLAYARALALDHGATTGTDSTRVLLRLLHFAIHHNTAAMQPAIAAAFAMVPPAAWEVLAPQLFVQLQHSQAHVRTYATQLLAALAGPVPASVLYTAVAAAGDPAAGAASPEIAELLAAVSGGSDDRVSHCRTLLEGLRLLTPLAAEAWQEALQAALVEIRRRVISLKAEVARGVAAVAEGEAAGPLWQRRYVAMVAHGVGRLRHLLQARYRHCLYPMLAEAELHCFFFVRVLRPT